MNSNIFVCIIVMAAVTYFIRVLPLVLIRVKIKNRFFRSFLYYVPFVTLSVMVFPSILTSTSSFISALIGFVIAVTVSFLGAGLPVVSLFAVAAVFVSELFIR